MPHRHLLRLARLWPYLAVVDPNHVLPRTYEWNAAVERTFGKADVFTVTYVGAAGRKLMRTDHYQAPNPNFGQFDLMRNDADSSYNALQAQYPPSGDTRPADAALLYLGACYRRRFFRRQLSECASGRIAFGTWFVRLRHPAHVLRRCVL